MELNIPVIALAQLSRGVESREDKRPMLSDLRESGSIEQDADIVVFLHRPGLIGLTDDPEELAKTEVIFAKNRNGQVGSVNMRYVGHLMKFEDDHNALYEATMTMDTSGSPTYNPFDEFNPSQNEFYKNQ